MIKTISLLLLMLLIGCGDSIGPKDGDYRIIKRKYGGYIVQRYRSFPHWYDFIEGKNCQSLTLDDAQKYQLYMEADMDTVVKREKP